ncbi:hypothetical protein HNP84_005046 [Thermocatellispora tengchongensis]|uniref:Uncharacterized protein n=1 Tax=Thermocatellispora tengchongensis TaxID=1073253 RepID=A0A840PD12_9ACTN|nr:hypothetical protein [Thermocatellispora tengchongensis]
MCAPAKVSIEQSSMRSCHYGAHVRIICVPWPRG